MVGFNNVPSGAKSPLCDGQEIGNLSSFGFSPLTSTGGTTANVAGSTCRHPRGLTPGPRSVPPVREPSGCDRGRP